MDHIYELTRLPDERIAARAHVHVLPAHWGTLDELTKLPSPAARSIPRCCTRRSARFRFRAAVGYVDGCVEGLGWQTCHAIVGKYLAPA